MAMGRTRPLVETQVRGYHRLLVLLDVPTSVLELQEWPFNESNLRGNVALSSDLVITGVRVDFDCG